MLKPQAFIEISAKMSKSSHNSPNSAITEQLLQKCAEVLAESSHESYLKADRATFHHPDIQFFKKIKARAIHRAPKTTAMNIKHIDPYSHEGLMERLKTFTPLNWRVPGQSNEDNELNEMTCARKGWKCVSFSLENNMKNHLICTSCLRQVFLKFDDLYRGEVHDDGTSQIEFENILKIQYLENVRYSGHTETCPWRVFESPLEGVYYLRPYLDTTNEIMINNYLKNLKVLVDNSLVLNEFASNFTEEFTSSEVDADFIRLSNKWLLHRYLKENKENFNELLGKTLSWFYKLAALGWSLKLQAFLKQLTILLVCSNCNKRIFFTATNAHEMDLSTTNILTPCKLPITSAADAEDIEEHHNPFSEHKPWCCVVKGLYSPTPSNVEYTEYLIWMVKNSVANLGSNGEFVSDDAAAVPRKREREPQKVDNLDRLSKLRRLYLIES